MSHPPKLTAQFFFRCSSTARKEWEKALGRKLPKVVRDFLNAKASEPYEHRKRYSAPAPKDRAVVYDDGINIKCAPEDKALWKLVFKNGGAHLARTACEAKLSRPLR